MLEARWIEITWRGVNKMHTGTVAGRVGDYFEALVSPGRYVLVHRDSIKSTSDLKIFRTFFPQNEDGSTSD